MPDLLSFFHIAGIIIALGAVTVIDTLGFISRKNRKLTQTTIQAHHITKPLIWIGTSLILVTYLLLPLAQQTPTKSTLLLILILNGSFLSFYISPRLDKLAGKNTLLPNNLQSKIATSMIISFISWWTFVALTILSL